MSENRPSLRDATVRRIAAVGGVALLLLVAICSVSARFAEGAALPGFNARGSAPGLAVGSIAAAAVASETDDRDGSEDVDAYTPRTDQSRAAGRIRVRTAAGAFLVYDAAVPPHRPRKRAGFLAYWNDFASGESYVYGRLMITQADVGHALWNLEADFGIDTVPLTMASSSLERGWAQAGREDPDETGWLPVSRWTMLSLMGFDPPDETSRMAVDEGRIAAEGEDDRFVSCCLMLDSCCAWVASILPVYPEPPPIDSTPDDVIVRTLTDLVCCTMWDPPFSPCKPCCNCLYGCCGYGCCPPCPEGCDDGDDCTWDSCVDGSCVHTPNPDPCCGIDDPCDPVCGDPCLCMTCNDEDPCTEDNCSDGTCSNPPGNDGAACDDGDPCTVNDRCSGGSCGGMPKDCDDGDQCTDDICDGGVCTHPPRSGLCDDGDQCTVNDICSGGSCAGTPKDCDDGDPCTDDICKGGGCINPPRSDGAACDDGDWCTIDDSCAGGVCVGAPRDCDDGDPCTLDECWLGECVASPGNPGGACPDDGNACTNDICMGGECTHPPTNEGAACDDEDECTIDDTCVIGWCVGVPRDCNDHDPCTKDYCWGGECDNTCVLDGPACDDGDGCTVGDICVAGVCVSGGPRDCDDGDPCTIDLECAAGACPKDPKCASGMECCTNGDCADRDWHMLTPSVSVELPSSFTNGVQDLVNALPGSTSISIQSSSFVMGSDQRDCCTPNGDLAQNGETQGDGTLSFELLGEGPIPTWAYSSDFELDFWGLVEIDLTLQVGVFWEFDVTLSGSGGRRQSQCNGDDCYYGNLSTGASLGLKAQLQATLCTETLWTDRDCTGLTITPLGVSASATGALQWNEPDCTSGFDTSVHIGTIEFYGTFSIPDHESVTVNYYTIDGFGVL